MVKSVLEAIRSGQWDFEPVDRACDGYLPTDAMPGTVAKLDILARRIREGLPLWHPLDRSDLEEPAPLAGKPR